MPHRCNPAPRRALVLATLGLLSALAAAPARSQIPGLRNGPVPTLAPLVREVTPAVVNISVQGKGREDNPLARDPFFREFFDKPRQVENEFNGRGSGVIVDAQKGYVLTASHVVGHVATARITTKEGRRFSAKVVGRDAETDIAVLQIQNGADLKVIALGDSDALEVGDFVIAVGNPFGLGQTVTSGLVSALGRTGLGKLGYEDFIQTDAPINPGNSGGALINMKGELVGINSGIISTGGGNVGIGFAVPIGMAKRVMEQIIATGKVKRGRIGVTVHDLPAPHAGRIDGALLGEVSTGSPAATAGIRKGDIIVKADGAPVRSAAQLRNKIGLAAIGEKVELTLERNGAPYTTTVEVAPDAETVKAAGTRKR